MAPICEATAKSNRVRLIRSNMRGRNREGPMEGVLGSYDSPQEYGMMS